MTLSRAMPSAMLVAAAAACAGTASSGRAPAAEDVRGAFGAASGVTATEGAADPRAFRVVPLRMPSGDAEIVTGHPDSAGPFVMRIRELGGTVIPPHSHPVDENLTVLSGHLYFGTGERFDSAATRRLDAGAYAFIPAGTTMFGYVPEGMIVQVHGTGPFHIHWRDSVRVLDEPGGQAYFRFRKGDAVDTPRGPGRIRQGYRSGALVQYEVDLADGTRFMAHEGAVRPR